MELDLLQVIRTNATRKSTGQPHTSEFGGRNSDLDMILDPTNDTAFSPEPNFLDFNVQMRPEEVFFMGDFLKDTLYDTLNPSTEETPRFDFGNVSMSTNTNLDYFISEAPNVEQLVSPSDLTAIPKPQPEATKKKGPTSHSSTPALSQEPAAGVPKKRARKRRQLDAQAQVIARNKFLERNRVAASQCREKKKTTYVDNLERLSKGMKARNTFLRGEMERLGQELQALRNITSTECGCDEEVLARNLRESLVEGRIVEEKGCEEAAEKFLRLKAEDLLVGIEGWEGMRMGNTRSILSSHL